VKPPALTARDVEEVLRDRILRGQYPPRGELPSVRELAGELGCSASTVGRAVQEMERGGWVRSISRRRVAVAARLPRETAAGDIASALRRLAEHWRLSGRLREEFADLVEQVSEEVFGAERRVVFLECNRLDLEQMGDQVEDELSVPVVRLLIEEARAHTDQLQTAVVLTPFFHLAEVRPLVPDSSTLVPLSFTPAESVLAELAGLAEGTRVGVIGADERSLRRIAGVVQQFSLAGVEGATVADQAAVERLIREADLVVAANAAGLSDQTLARARRALRVRFRLDPSSVPAPGVAAVNRLDGTTDGARPVGTGA
jgi:DNA-binding transcriptional regulator YhcF (GntR family)